MLPPGFSWPSAAPVSSTAGFSVSVANCSRCASCTDSACCSANSRRPRSRSSGSPPNGNPNPPPSTSSPLVPGLSIVPASGEMPRERDELARDEAGLVGHLVDDAEEARQLARRLDDDGHDRHAAGPREQPVAVRRVLAGEAPDAAQRGRAARPLLPQAANELDVERVPAVARLLPGEDGQLVPRGLPRLRLRQQAPVALADAHALERRERRVEP